ncbi:MAG: hypothetical protein COA78_20325 [Blastopirellula sp.]|nr:MAG: hypothetical protein COA78_20325 [Blastopirellula sp.]
MGVGYTRVDTGNNIADGNVIDAADLDGEFDGVEAAFHASTGHTHDGTAAEGAPIAKMGPAQEYLSDGTSFNPKTDNTYDLGTALLEWKDLYVDGVAYLDSSTITTLTTDLSTVTSVGDLAVADGGTGSSTAGAARTALGVVPGTDVQAYDATLLSIAALGTAADKLAYTTGVDTWAETAITTAGRALIDDASASAQRTTMGVAVGSDVQAWDAQLDDIAALAVANSNFIVANGTNWVAETGATARTSLGVPGDASTATISGAWNYTTDTTMSANLTFGDADELRFGAGNDFSILHNGTATNIINSKTLSLQVRSDFGVTFLSNGSTETVATFLADGACSLYFNNSVKIATTTTGVTVTGDLVATGAVEGSSYVNVPGWGQTWQDMSGSRAASTAYQNTTGSPISVSVWASTGTGRNFSVSTDNITYVPVGRLTGTGVVEQMGSFVIPDQHYYKIDGAVTSINGWAELR